MSNSRLHAWRCLSPLILLVGMLATLPALAVEAPSEALDATRKPIDLRRIDADADAPPVVLVRTPNTAVIWAMGASRRLEWTASDDRGVRTIDIDLTIDGGATWLPVAAGLPDSGRYDWKVPNLNTGDARVRITARDASGQAAVDASDVSFEIRDRLKPTMTVTTPRGGQIWGTGELKRLTWKATDNWGVKWVDLAYSADGGASWIAIAERLPNSGGHWWTIPTLPVTEAALVKATATDSAGLMTSDTSDSLFRIRDRSAPASTWSRPAGGEAWNAGSQRTLAWSATDNVAVTAVDLDASSDRGLTWTPIASAQAAAGSFPWTVPGAVPSDLNSVREAGDDEGTPGSGPGVWPADLWMRMTARDGAGNASSDTSVIVVTEPDPHAPVVAVVAPNGGERWEIGVPHSIQWNASDDRGVAAIDVAWSADAGATWTSLGDGLANVGSLTWIPEPPPIATALVRVTARDSAGNVTADVSDTAFALVVPPDTTSPTVQLLAPNGGEVWPAEGTRVIRWSAADDVGVHSVDLEYSQDGGASWTTIAAAIPDGGNHAWTAPLAPSATARVRVVVRDAAGNVASDASDADFEVQAIDPFAERVISLRADRADGTGPYPAGASSPWVDLAGDHDGAVAGFNGTAVSGWVGDGAPGNPHRLEFAGEEPGWNTRVAIPGGSVPELQAIGGLTASVWFKTGFDGVHERYEYVLEWVQKPTPDMNPEYEGRGMSIVVQNGTIQVYANPWIEIAPAAPNTWYHVVVAKDTSLMRVFVNGELRHAGTKSHRGIQESEIALGASIFRRFEGRDGDTAFEDRFRGAIAQFELWDRVLEDDVVTRLFRADSAIFLTPAPTPADSAVVRLDAARAGGLGAPSVPGAAGPWVDLAGGDDGFDLVGFDGNAASGWAGDGSAASPYRLEFDGVNDAAAIGVGRPTAMNAAGVEAFTLDVTFRTASSASADFRYLAEWLHAFGAGSGLSLAVTDDKLRIYSGSWVWTDLAVVAPDTWYRATVVKGPGVLRAYLDGALVYETAAPNFGLPLTGIAIGASLWRGAGQYGDFWQGAISQVTLWPRSLEPAEIGTAVTRRVDSERAARTSAAAAPGTLELAGAWPNPARGAFQVGFALPTSAPARLELLDVSGRRIETQDVGALGAGRHVVTMGAGQRSPGVYWLRLAQSGRAVVTRVAAVE